MYTCVTILTLLLVYGTEIDDFTNFIEFNKSNYFHQKNIIETSVQNAFKLLVFTKKNKDLVSRFNCSENKIIIQSVKIFSSNL